METLGSNNLEGRGTCVAAVGVKVCPCLLTEDRMHHGGSKGTHRVHLGCIAGSSSVEACKDVIYKLEECVAHRDIVAKGHSHCEFLQLEQ